MSSPTKEDLPTLASDLKTELEQEHQLNPAETEEKVVLPSQEDIQAEKTELEKNSLPSQEDSEQEKSAPEEASS